MKNKLFSPAIVLMNRLNYTRKFIVLGLIYLVAIAVVVYGLYASLNQVVRTSQRQLEGLELIKPISRAVQFMQQHRGLSTGVLGGNEAMRSASDTKEIEIAAAFDLIEQRLPASGVLSGDWTRLKADWNGLRKNWPRWTVDHNFTLHTDLIDRMLVFEVHIADDYALTFDSDIEAFYLIDTIINKMPQALERLGQIRALGTGILAKKQISAYQQAEMGVLIAELRHELKFLVISLEKTGRFNPQIQSPLLAVTEDIVDSMHQVIDLVHADISSGRFVTSSEDFFKKLTVAIDKGYRQMDRILLPKTEALISARVQHTENNLHLSLGIAVLLLLVAHYFLIGIYYAMVGSMRSLIHSARAFANGDMGERIDLGTRDELREVGDSFNEMADGFNALLAARLEDKVIEARLRSIIDASPIPMILNDDRQNITFLNPAFIQTFGYTLENIPTLADWWSKAAGSDPEYRQWMAANWHGTLVHNDSQVKSVEFSIQCRSGATKTVLANASLVEQASGAVCLVALYDITWRKQAEADLRIAAIAFDIQEAMMVTDASQVILKVNQAFTRITGYSAEEAVGNTPALLKSGHQDAKFYQTMWESLARDGYWQSEIWNRRKCGEVYPQRITITAVTNAEGKTTNYIATFDDISKYKKAEETIHDLCFYDSLTKLPNRRLLLERLRHSIEVERREGKQLALMMLDLDRFKVINDSLGYVAGDELLQQVAARIATRLRKVDLVARMRKVDLLAHLGGDEFIMLLEDITHTEDAARVAEHIIAILNKPFYLSQGDEIHITASIGISLYPQHGDDPDVLISYADAALSQAKAEGRGCFAYYSEELTLAARKRIELETRLRKAIEQQELRVFYQPQIDIGSGRIIGAEALLRWLDPVEGVIPPLRFIPLAEETGLILEIGEWVLRETCRQGKQWLDAGLSPLTLAVNVSAHQFRRSDIGALVTTVLSETGFPAEQLELEMTESGLMESQDKVMALLNKLRALGVRFAIDDFGTGYSSLAYLKHFPLDSLKIDKSFIDDIPHMQDDMEIAATIIAMGHMLGFKVLAEGVETVEQLAFLQSKGCDAYQGYLQSKPVPADEFVKLLSGHGASKA